MTATPSRTRLACAALAGAVLALGLPAAASADLVVGMSGPTVTVTGTADNVQVFMQADRLNVRDVGGAVTTVAGSGCGFLDAQTAFCHVGIPGKLQATFGDGDDTVKIIDQGGAGEGLNATVSLGAGNDTYLRQAPGSDTTVDGGPGNDTLSVSGGTVTGGDGDDTITGGATADGGAGNDTISTDGTLIGGDGVDHLTGGVGNNTIVPGIATPDGADIVDGGGGTDTVSYAPALSGVSVTLGSTNGAGMDGDGDSLTSIENVTGGAGNDKLTGDAGPNAIDGGAGNDQIGGGAGNDTLTGGDGQDAFSGGTGADTINARDGIAEKITCGTDTVGKGVAQPLDSVVLDLKDPTPSDCESVDKAAIHEGPTVKIAGGRHTAHHGRLAFAMSCPKGSGGCRGSLRVGSGRATRYSIAEGGGATVRVRLSAADARALRKHALALRVVSVERGRDGAKTRQITVPVR